MTATELHDLAPAARVLWHQGFYWGLVHGRRLEAQDVDTAWLDYAQGVARGRTLEAENMDAAWVPVSRFVKSLGSPSSKTFAQDEAARRDTSCRGRCSASRSASRSELCDCAQPATGWPVPTPAECAASWREAS